MPRTLPVSRQPAYACLVGELIEITDEERDALKEVAAELCYRVTLTDRDDLRLAFLAGLLTAIAARPPAFVAEPSLSR
jgi:hypothetical protein